MSDYYCPHDDHERHLARATQKRIARWVDQTRKQSPCNPFAPLPSERSATIQTPQSAFYETPQGNIPPTYSNSRTHEHGQWHSPSQQSTPPQAIMPQARPLYGRSFSSPPPSAEHFLPSKPYPPYPTAPSRIPSPFSSRYHDQPSPMSHRSSSRDSFISVRSPHNHPNTVIHGGNIYPYFPPSLPQPMVPHNPQPVVVYRLEGNRGITVVPPSGHCVQVFVCFFTIMFSSW